MPKPRLVDAENDVVRPIAAAPRRQRRRKTRRWPLLFTLLFALGASLVLWSAIFGLVQLVVNLLF